MWEEAEPILQMAFPDGPEARAPSGLLERLELVPKRLRAKLKHTALTATVQALAIVKSHYPDVDLHRFDEVKLECLSIEVEPTTERLVDFLDLDDL